MLENIRFSKQNIFNVLVLNTYQISKSKARKGYHRKIQLHSCENVSFLLKQKLRVFIFIKLSENSFLLLLFSYIRLYF